MDLNAYLDKLGPSVVEWQNRSTALVEEAMGAVALALREEMGGAAQAASLPSCRAVWVGYANLRSRVCGSSLQSLWLWALLLQLVAIAALLTGGLLNANAAFY